MRKNLLYLKDKSCWIYQNYLELRLGEGFLRVLHFVGNFRRDFSHVDPQGVAPINVRIWDSDGRKKELWENTAKLKFAFVSDRTLKGWFLISIVWRSFLLVSWLIVCNTVTIIFHEVPPSSLSARESDSAPSLASLISETRTDECLS